MRCRANRWPKTVQNVRDTKTRANFRNCGKLCTETECEDATLEGQESTCGNRQKCPIFKHLVLVVPEERLIRSLGATNRKNEESNWRSTSVC
jgi:hypothetical protein